MQGVLSKIDLLRIRAEVAAAKFPNYQVGHGGGVLIFIHNSLTWEVMIKGSNELEVLAISVGTSCSACKNCIYNSFVPSTVFASHTFKR